MPVDNILSSRQLMSNRKMEDSQAYLQPQCDERCMADYGFEKWQKTQNPIAPRLLNRQFLKCMRMNQEIRGVLVAENALLQCVSVCS